jgi:hypothetical protein
VQSACSASQVLVEANQGSAVASVASVVNRVLLVVNLESAEA